MFWHTPVVPHEVGACRHLGSVYVILETRQGLGAVDELLAEERNVEQQDLPGSPWIPYRCAGAYAYRVPPDDPLVYVLLVYLNPNYIPPFGTFQSGHVPGTYTPGQTPSTPPGPPVGVPPGLSPTGSPPAVGLGSLGQSAVNYLLSMPPYTSGYCAHCSAPAHFGCGCNPDGFDVESDHSPSCAHTELVDTGMPVRYCKHCPAKLRLVNLEWTVVP